MHVNVIHPGDIDWRFPAKDPRKYDCTILAEGDSWFSLGGVPAGNILYQLTASRNTLVVTIADPGDTIVHMGDRGHMREFARLVAEPQFAYRWSAILLSGGGNDLIDAAPGLLINSAGSPRPEDYVNPAAMTALLDRVQSAFKTLVEVRDGAASPNRDVPIYVHTYDYATPRPSPSRVFGAAIGGPWLYPAFDLSGIAPGMWQQVSDWMLDRLAQAILSLDCRLPQPVLTNFYVSDTRNLLQRASSTSEVSDGDWLNEIHPSATGNGKIARKLSEAMRL